MKIHEKLKQIRKMRGLSIKELSEKTGLSAGFISNIERNINSPSIANLQTLCQILNVNIIDLLKKERSSVTVLKKEERTLVFDSSSEGTKYYNLTPDNSKIDGICVVIEPNGVSDSTNWGHNHDEVGLVIEGELELEVAQEGIYHLSKGDTIYIKRNTPHRHKNPSSTPSITYWFSINKEKI